MSSCRLRRLWVSLVLTIVCFNLLMMYLKFCNYLISFVINSHSDSAAGVWSCHESPSAPLCKEKVCSSHSDSVITDLYRVHASWFERAADCQLCWRPLFLAAVGSQNCTETLDHFMENLYPSSLSLSVCGFPYIRTCPNKDAKHNPAVYGASYMSIVSYLVGPSTTVSLPSESSFSLASF